MKKVFIISIFMMVILSGSVAQNLGIGTNTPHKSAKLEIKSSNSGLLLPRMTTAQRSAIAGPAKGLMVYDSTLKQFCYHDGTSWKTMAAGGSNAPGWSGSNDANGDKGYKATFPDELNRMVFLNSPVMGKEGYYGVFRVGAVSIYNPFVNSTQNILTLDGQTIQARFKYTADANPYEDEYETNLLLNKFGGNVGIGTANAPHAKLEVNGSVGAVVAMFGADGFGVGISKDNPEIGFNYYYNGGTKTIKAGYGANLGMSPGSGDFYIGNFNNNKSSSDFGNIDGYQYTMLIKQNGNVGIGTTNPLYKLSVNGQIQAKEIRVETGWADFVFEDDYVLPDLQQVEQHIKDHKHLPGIPAADEIQKNGLAVGELQTKMMQKIEELTLYIIKQDKRIERLEQQLTKTKKAKK